MIGAVALIGLSMPPALLAEPAVPSWGAPVFVAHVPLDGAWFASQIAVADFNGDGHQDVLITRNSQDAQHTFPVTVLLGDGAGHFTDGTRTVFEGDVPATQFARQIVVADFNGDGRPDAFIADTGDDHDPFPGYQNTLILSAAGGKLVDATSNLPQVSDYTHSAAAADVNGDGAIDLYVGNIYGANNIGPRILLNDGTGRFTVGDGLLPPAQSDLNQNVYPGSTFTDVNGDGRPDLVLSADGSTSQSVVLLNDGTGHFTLLPNALPAKPFGSDAIGLGTTSFDINGDGRPDLLIGYTKNNPFYVGRWIQMLINNGDGSFSDQTASLLPQSDNSDTWPEFFQPRDLQRDGRNDFGLVSNGTGDDSPHLYLRDQNGRFQPGPAIAISFQNWAFIDATGNGSNDIIGDTQGGDVWLIPEQRGTPTPPPPARPPTLSRLNLTPTSFRAAGSGASVARAKTGTTVTYSLSEASKTTFTVELALPGQRRGHRCVAARPRTRAGHRCTRYLPVRGRFAHMGAAGRTHFHFSGRIGGRALKAGNYRLDATPTSAAHRTGHTVQTRFRILSRR